MILLIDMEKAFDRIHHPIHDKKKTLSKLDRRKICQHNSTV